MPTNLYDIEQAVSRVEDAVERSSTTSLAFWTYAGYMLFSLLVTLSLIHLMPGDLWHSRLRYFIQYNVNPNRVRYDNVFVGKQPHDCDFLAAPIGEKYCEYKPVVTTTRWATSTTGVPIVSYAGGPWNQFTPYTGAFVPLQPMVVAVVVSWQKEGV
jgi:hypothetical protein